MVQTEKNIYLWINYHIFDLLKNPGPKYKFQCDNKKKTTYNNILNTLMNLTQFRADQTTSKHDKWTEYVCALRQIEKILLTKQ